MNAIQPMIELQVMGAHEVARPKEAQVQPPIQAALQAMRDLFQNAEDPSEAVQFLNSLAGKVVREHLDMSFTRRITNVFGSIVKGKNPTDRYSRAFRQDRSILDAIESVANPKVEKASKEVLRTERQQPTFRSREDAGSAERRKAEREALDHMDQFQPQGIDPSFQPIGTTPPEGYVARGTVPPEGYAATETLPSKK